MKACPSAEDNERCRKRIKEHNKIKESFKKHQGGGRFHPYTCRSKNCREVLKLKYKIREKYYLFCLKCNYHQFLDKEEIERIVNLHDEREGEK